MKKDIGHEKSPVELKELISELKEEIASYENVISLLQREIRYYQADLKKQESMYSREALASMETGLQKLEEQNLKGEIGKEVSEFRSHVSEMIRDRDLSDKLKPEMEKTPLEESVLIDQEAFMTLKEFDALEIRSWHGESFIAEWKGQTIIGHREPGGYRIYNNNINSIENSKLSIPNDINKELSKQSLKVDSKLSFDEFKELEEKEVIELNGFDPEKNIIEGKYNGEEFTARINDDHVALERIGAGSNENLLEETKILGKDVENEI